MYYRYKPSLREKVWFKIMPKGYGRASQEVRDFIEEMYRQIEDNDRHYENLNLMCCNKQYQIQTAIEYIKNKIRVSEAIENINKK